ESRHHRDGAVAAFLGYFLIITNFLYTQSIPTALAMGVGVFAITATLVGFSAPQRAPRANLRTAGLLLTHAAPAALVPFLLSPHNHYWLFALETAAALPERSRITQDGQILSFAPVRSRLPYDMSSVIDPAREPRENRGTLGRALRLPADYNKRTVALANEWRAAGGSDVDMLNRGIAFLRKGRFTYTLEPPLLGRDAVDEFLFDSKAGFC